MDPRKYPIPRKRLGSVLIFELTDTTLIEENSNHVEFFKHIGCLSFCQNIEGYHLEKERKMHMVE
jgi:hypothetical protein